MLILLFGRAIDQGNEVHGFQNGFDQSIVGTINHFQQLRLIGSYRNNQSPPTASCSINAAGISGGAAVTNMPSKGAFSGQPA